MMPKLAMRYNRQVCDALPSSTTHRGSPDVAGVVRLPLNSGNLDLENYAARLDAQFLSNPLCHGLTFIRFPWGGSGNKSSLEERSAINWSFLAALGPGGRCSRNWGLREPILEITA
jgi:hypothetical protein